jgi:hypothetical protein
MKAKIDKIKFETNALLNYCIKCLEIQLKLTIGIKGFTENHSLHFLVGQALDD